MHDVRMTWTPLSQGGFTYLGVHYHVHDFVYVHDCATQDATAVLLDIVQIVEFLENPEGGLHLRVRKYDRYDDVVKHSNVLLPGDNVSASVTCTMLMF